MEAIKVSALEFSKIPDNTVVKRVLNGEKELYEILLRRYNQTLFRVVRSYLRDTKDVEDVMQETYLKAYLKLHQFKSEAAFSTWLIRIGINEALQKIRKDKRREIINLVSNEELKERIIQLKTVNPVSPEDKTIYNETKHLIENAIDLLPEKYKVIYMLHEVEGMSNTEIANCLNISLSNVKVRLHRAKGLLKELLYKISSDASIFQFGNKHCDAIVNYVMHNI